MSSRVFFIGAIALAVALAFFGRQLPSERLPIVHAGALRDRSLSDREGCTAFTGIVSGLIESAIVRRGSTMTLAVTGDNESANEPIQLSVGEPPIESGRSIEGPDEIRHRRAAFLVSVYDACRSAGASERSPIHLAIKRIVAQVNQLGDDDSKRIVWIQTDLEELSEQAIKIALRDPRRDDFKRLTKIENDRVSIRFCGEAETRGRVTGSAGQVILTRPRKVELADRAHEVWAGVFTAPSNVSFTPFCPKWTAATSPSTD